MQFGPLREDLLRYTYLTSPLFDGESEATLDVWFGLLFDGVKSVDMMTISLQTISDNLNKVV
jgi:hypothetical protein